jgi:hypothetical protein
MKDPTGQFALVPRQRAISEVTAGIAQKPPTAERGIARGHSIDYSAV